MESNIIFKPNKQFYKEENESFQLTKNLFSKNSNEIFKKKHFLLGKTYLEESTKDDYIKIQIPVKKFSYKNMNKNKFVPNLKPLEINFRPSILKLNTNSILNKNYCNTYPNTEELSSDFISNDEDNLIYLRKKLKIIKSSIPKVFSSKIINKNYFELDNEEFSNNDNDYIYSESDNNYEIKNLNYINEKDNENKYYFNSCSILQILENKI